MPYRKYLSADNSVIIPQAHKGMPYRTRVHLIKLWAFEDGKKAYFEIIPQAHKGMPYRITSSFDQVMGF